MTRPLAVAFGLLAMATVANAQPQRPAVPIGPAGYIAIRFRPDSEPGTGNALPGQPPGFGGGAPGGQPQAPPGGFPGMPGGLPGMPGGYPGMPGGLPGMPGGMPGGPDTGSVSKDKSLVVVVPHKGIFRRMFHPAKRYDPATNIEWKPVVRTEYGETFLLDNSPPFQVYYSELQSLPVVLKQRHDKEVLRANTLAKRYDLMFDLIKSALEFGELDLAIQYAKEAAKWADAKDAKADALPPKMDAFLTAFKTVEPKWSQPLPPDRAVVESWQRRLKATNVASSDHYALLNSGDQYVTTDALNRRLAALEKNFKAFYLTHALRGTALPLPAHPLPVVLLSNGSKMAEFHNKLAGGPIVADAFYTPTHGLLVMSPSRSDELALTFRRSIAALGREGWDLGQLLKGAAPEVKEDTPPTKIVKMMTYALVERALEDEGITAAVTREGTRQLNAAVGLLPKYVQLPDWVEYGVSSQLELPMNPGIVTAAKTPSLTVGVRAWAGAPNYVHLREFQDLLTAKELPAEEVLLRRVLTDAYFNAWRQEKDLDYKPLGPVGPGNFPGAPPMKPPGGTGRLVGNPELAQQPPQPPPGFPGGMPGGYPGMPGGMPGMPGGMPGMPGMPGGMPGMPGAGGVIENGPSLAALRLAKAEATSWALVYYLTTFKGSEWKAFTARLDRMPRDMKLDKQLVLREFALAFGLTKAGTAEPTIDEDEFKLFAQKWVDFVKGTPRSWETMALRADQPNNGGGQPGGPGGFPGGPGGFPGGPGGPGGGR